MSHRKLSALTLLILILSIATFFATPKTAADSTPAVEWQQSYGTSRGIQRIIQPSNESYIFIKNGWSYQMTAIQTSLNKIDVDGNVVWSKVVRAVDLVQSYDDGYAVLQSISDGAALVKYDSSDQLEWNVTYPDYSVYRGNLVATGDSGYLVVISNSSTWDFQKVEGTDYRQFTTWLMKTDWLGNVQWSRSYSIGGTENTKDISTFELKSLIQTDDGGYLIGGEAIMKTLDSDFCVAKIDNDGELQWVKTYGGEKDDDFSSLCQTSDGCYVLCGTSHSYNGVAIEVYPTHVEGVPPNVNRKTGDKQALLVKIYSSGETVWSHTYGVNTVKTSTYGTDDRASASSVMQTSDGKLTFAGSELRVYTGFDEENPMVGGTMIWLVKCDLQGNMLWSADYDQGWQADTDVATYLMETENGSYLIAGTKQNIGGANVVCFLIKTESVLPKPTPSPTPIWTPPTGASSSTSNSGILEMAAIFVIILASVAGAVLLNVNRKKPK